MERRVSESHSESDSGESWTLLDSAPSYTTTESPSPCLRALQPHREGTEKDDDTDGISVVSECESETNESCEQVEPDECASAVEPRPVERDEDDGTKLKSYVHRRNTRVSSALNVIVLGSVVTAACLAIGHMWGVRDECVHQNSSSVNKLLSNLYKLQEENAYLRSKLKELTIAGHGQLQLKRNSTPKQCKKEPEAPLQRADVIGTDKCVDQDKCVDADAEIDRPLLKYPKTEPTQPQQHVEIDENEKQFQNDFQKLRKMYEENRSWLERQLTKRQKNEKDLANGQVRQPQTRPNANVEIIEKNEIFRVESNPVRPEVPAATLGDRTKERQRASSSKEKYRRESKQEILDEEFSPPQEKRPAKPKRERFINERYKNRDAKIKNDRYENKYEVENGSRHNAKTRDRVDSRDKKYSPDYDMHLNYIDKFSHSDRKNAKQKRESKTKFVIFDKEKDDSMKQKNDSAGDSLIGNWSQNRSEMRSRARQEAREVTSQYYSARASGRWYFRRMREREQLRARSVYTDAH